MLLLFALLSWNGSPALLRCRHASFRARPPRVSAESSLDATGFEELVVRPEESSGSFETLGLNEPLLAANLAASNITHPNALQRATFAPLAAGRDAIVHAHTGSGKTLAFLLPLIEQLDPTSREPQALVLSPSRELAYQTYRVAQALLAGTSLSAMAVAGGANPNRQIEKLRKDRPQLLIGSAGRVSELAFETKKLKLQRVRHLVLDEVDEALREPHIQHTSRIIDSMRDGRPLQLLFFSATADTLVVRRTAYQLMASPMLVQLAPEATEAAEGGSGASPVLSLPPTLTHAIAVVPKHKRLEALSRLAHTSPKPTALVFVNSPHRARIVCEQLRSSYGVAAEALYGEQERQERVALMRALTEGRVPLLISTEMGARGLDLPLLSHVVNLEMPTDHLHYVHRAGRVGRAGAPGTVLSLVAPSDANVVEKFASRLSVSLVPTRLHGGELLPLERAHGGPRRPSRRTAPRSSDRRAAPVPTKAAKTAGASRTRRRPIAAKRTASTR